MIATPVPVIITPPLGAPRSRGVHVSSIIRCIAAETGILKPEWVEELSLVDMSSEGWWEQLDTVAKLRISMGLAWEEWYLPRLEGVTDHPGEMQLDGVYMTHDGESLDMVWTERKQTYVLAVHEVKLTYKSLNTVAPRYRDGELALADLESQWMWVTQLQAYCKGLGTTLGYLHPLFVCGNYSWPIRPRLGPYEDRTMCWRVEFTQEEIDMKWETMLDYVRERKHLIPPQYDFDGRE